MAKEAKILIVDDEADMRTMLKQLFERKGPYSVITSGSPIEGLKIVKEWHPDVLVTDVRMQEMDGIELLKRVLAVEPYCSTVVITGFGTVEMAVEAIKLGAYDFLEKPFDNTKVLHTVKRAVERTRLLKENARLSRAVCTEYDFHGIIGSSPAIQGVKKLIEQIAPTDETVLIQGESGTGKELAARAIHALSHRSRRKMITINCAALPESILESELFGYEKGAFTGASRTKKGLFLQAQRSTILLDEIGDMPVSLQTKLLRVLQEKEIRPLGAVKDISIDVRVIAATNKNLVDEMTRGMFREDLFFRLNVVSIRMPSLREMKDDIPLLANHFLRKFSLQFRKEGLEFSEDALILLTRRRWRGNVRELENAIKRAVLLNRTGKIVSKDLAGLDHGGEQASCEDKLFEILMNKPYNEAKKEVIARFSLKYLQNILKITKGNVTEAARRCGIERQALQRLMRQYAIRSSSFRQTD